jgi:hypothetical protein
MPRFSRAKPTGAYRIYSPASRSVSHAKSLAEARKDARYFVKAGSMKIEIQRRFPSGHWTTIETVGR